MLFKSVTKHSSKFLTLTSYEINSSHECNEIKIESQQIYDRSSEQTLKHGSHELSNA